MKLGYIVNQPMLMMIHDFLPFLHGLLEAVDRQHAKHGPEHLLVQDRCVALRVEDNGRRHVAPGGVEGASAEILAAVAGEELADALRGGGGRVGGAAGAETRAATGCIWTASEE